MDFISYSDAKFALTVGNLRLKIAGIDTSLACPNTGTTNVEAMKKFVELYEELGYMMQEYRSLLEKDQQALEKVGLEIKLQDIALSRLFIV